jgi:hypothetical protein
MTRHERAAHFYVLLLLPFSRFLDNRFVVLVFYIASQNTQDIKSPEFTRIKKYLNISFL